jgi:hypothetical protein
MSAAEKIETEEKKVETKKTETKSMTWRMPVWVAAEFSGDWSGFRDILDNWAQEAEELDIPENPDETTSVCLRVSLKTLAMLEKEAKRLTKKTKRKWTAGKVARKIYEDKYEKAE